jgi:OOP family OmpA-OmpF porin
MNRRMNALAALVLAAAAMLAQAQALPADAPGAKDHPAIARYAGSWLVGKEVKEFDAAAIATGPKDSDLVNVEGRITRLYYLAPAGRSALEVQRNYEAALEKAGATRRDACSGEACGSRKLGAGKVRLKAAAAGKVGGWSGDTLLEMWRDRGAEQRYWYGTLSRGGAAWHVSVVTAPSGLAALRDRHVGTVVQIVEPNAMDAAMVVVDAAALTRGLQAEGKVPLYGLFFDTGKAELKPESRPQLEQMASLLQGQAALKVYIVGHTDNQGTLEGNLALSRARAQAVVDALVKAHKIDPRRLAAGGVASYAPLASNAGDAGRARNRRVELVLQ